MHGTVDCLDPTPGALSPFVDLVGEDIVARGTVQGVLQIRTGRYDAYYRDGAPLATGTVDSWCPDGEWTGWYPDGTLWFTGSFLCAERYGPWKVNHPNGQTRVEGSLELMQRRRDNCHSLLKTCQHERVESAAVFPAGTWRYYTADGTLLAEYQLDEEGTGRWGDWTADGTLLFEYDVVKGRADGPVVMYYDDAITSKFIAHCKAGRADGNYFSFAEDGSLTHEGSYVDGERQGLWKVRLDDGTLVEDDWPYRKHGSLIEYPCPPPRTDLPYWDFMWYPPKRPLTPPEEIVHPGPPY